MWLSSPSFTAGDTKAPGGRFAHHVLQRWNRSRPRLLLSFFVLRPKSRSPNYHLETEFDAKTRSLYGELTRVPLSILSVSSSDDSSIRSRAGETLSGEGRGFYRGEGLGNSKPKACDWLLPHHGVRGIPKFPGLGLAVPSGIKSGKGHATSLG